MTDLSTVSTDDLVAELKARHDALVLFAEIDRTADESAYVHYTSGKLSRIIGMLTRARRRILRYADQVEALGDEEQE